MFQFRRKGSYVKTHPCNNAKLLQLLDSILNIKIAFLVKFFLNELLTPNVKILGIKK